MNNNVIKILLNFKNKGRVENTIEAIPKDHHPIDNVIEAEKGEVVLTYDDKGLSFPKIYVIGGKKHKDGGTDLDLPDNSFIFSDSKDMVIRDPSILALFDEEKPKTFAQIAKKYLFNESSDIIENDKGDVFAKNRALNDIDNKMGKLALLAIIQERSKNNQDIPTFAAIYFRTKGIDINSLLDSQSNTKEEAGNVKAERGLEVLDSDLADALSSDESNTQPTTDATTQQDKKSKLKKILRVMGAPFRAEAKLYKSLFDVLRKPKGGLEYLNELQVMSGIAERMGNMQLNAINAMNNPVNTDTTSPVFNLTDRGDYVVAGSQYGQFRPNEQNPTAAFAYGVPNPLIGSYYIAGQNTYFDEGGEKKSEKPKEEQQKEESKATGDDKEEITKDKLREKVGNILKSIYGDTIPAETIEYFNKYIEDADKDKLKSIYDDLNNLNNIDVIKEKIKKNIENNKKQIENEAKYVNDRVINDIVSTNILNIFRNHLKNDKGEIPIIIEKKDKNGTKLEIQYYKPSYLDRIQNGKKWHKSIKDGNPVIFTNPSFNNTNDIEKYTALFQAGFYDENKKDANISKIDRWPGSKTTTQNFIEEFVEKSPQPQQPQQPQQSQKQEPPKQQEPPLLRKDANVVNAPTETPTPSGAKDLGKKKQEELNKKLQEFAKKVNKDYPFYKQDVNTIVGALANITNIKKYMPFETVGDVYLGRPVFYSPDRQIQQVQQTATSNLRAAQGTLPAQLVNAYASTIQGASADQIANILGNISNANVGLANQYEATKGQVLSELGNRIAQTQNLAYKESVIANQQFDDARRKAYAALIAAYNNALKNRANRITANTVYLGNTPFYVDDTGAIRFDPNYKPDISAKYENAYVAFRQFVDNLNRMPGLTDKAKEEMIRNYLEQHPEVYEALQYGDIKTGQSTNPGDVDVNTDIKGGSGDSSGNANPPSPQQKGPSPQPQGQQSNQTTNNTNTQNKNSVSVPLPRYDNVEDIIIQTEQGYSPNIIPDFLGGFYSQQNKTSPAQSNNTGSNSQNEKQKESQLLIARPNDGGALEKGPSRPTNENMIMNLPSYINDTKDKEIQNLYDNQILYDENKTNYYEYLKREQGGDVTNVKNKIRKLLELLKT